jgi:hypothetical protein
MRQTLTLSKRKLPIYHIRKHDTEKYELYHTHLTLRTTEIRSSSLSFAHGRSKTHMLYTILLLECSLQQPSVVTKSWQRYHKVPVTPPPTCYGIQDSLKKRDRWDRLTDKLHQRERRKERFTGQHSWGYTLFGLQVTLCGRLFHVLKFLHFETNKNKLYTCYG